MGSRVILLPGGVIPASVAYGALVEALDDDVATLTKDLELYAGPQPQRITRSNMRSQVS